MRSERLNYYIDKVQAYPPHILMKKAFIKSVEILTQKLEKFDAKFFPRHITDDQLLENLKGITSLQELLRCIRGKRPNFFIDTSKKEDLINLIQKEFPDSREEIIGEADKVCSHVFNLLGSGDVNLDDFIRLQGGRQNCGYLPWHFDFKIGYSWKPDKFYKEIKIPYGIADIKVPWELSRFQHLTTLGQAYWLTKEERYAKEFVDEIDDWINQNPPKFGVNWACAMDVAIRVCNWIWGYYFFKDSPVLTDEFMIMFIKSLLIHGRHIMANLENRGFANNHYLADLAGLIYLGVCFPEFKEAKIWRDYGIKELIKEMGRQVYDDGMDFEASTCYHRLALELFFYPALLLNLNGVQLPNTFIEKMKKMFDFVLYVLKPNGRMPQIGDNDNGRLHILKKREILDMTYLLGYASIYYNDFAYKVAEFGFAPECLWLFGRESYLRYEAMRGRSLHEIGSNAFRDSGIYVMRNNKDYMIISCGPNGQGGLGGHCHNDKLSFELCADGTDIIVDSGTYTYTADPDERNRYRSTIAHNTIMINGEEQNKSSMKELFRMQDDAKARSIYWKNKGEFDIFIGEHSGYMRISPAMIHRRVIQFHKPIVQWIIEDKLLIMGKHKNGIACHIEMLMNFAPNLTIKVEQVKYETIVLVSYNGVDKLVIKLRDKNPSKGIIQRIDIDYSVSYGQQERGEGLKWIYDAQSLRSIVFQAEISKVDYTR